MFHILFSVFKKLILNFENTHVTKSTLGIWVEKLPLQGAFSLDIGPHSTLIVSQNLVFSFVVVQSLSCVWLFATPWLQHARLLCPSPSPGACSNSSPLSRWCHPTISFYCCPLLLPAIFPSIKVFSSEPALCIRWPKYWSFSFSISPSNKYSGPISFRIDWLDLLSLLSPTSAF